MHSERSRVDHESTGYRDSPGNGLTSQLFSQLAGFCWSPGGEVHLEFSWCGGENGRRCSTGTDDEDRVKAGEPLVGQQFRESGAVCGVSMDQFIVK